MPRTQDAPDDGDAVVDFRRGGRGVAEDESGLAGPLPVPGQRLRFYDAVERGGGQVDVGQGRAAGQPVEGERQVQAGRGAVHPGPGEMDACGTDHGVAAADMTPAQEPQVVFQLA
jgi:hypothetical protein